MISSVKNLIEFLGAQGEAAKSPIDRDFLSPLKQSLVDFQKLEEMIEQSIDVNRAKQNEYIINPEFSQELKTLHEQILAAHR